MLTPAEDLRIPAAHLGAFMTDVLGFSVVAQMPGRIRLAVNGNEPSYSPALDGAD